ncbi:MAG: hypothetical protein QXD05_00255 [Candidatus Pacearchaeota archaeon]
MRFYDYKCIRCSKEKEFYENIEDEKYIHRCDCGGEMMRIIITPPNFYFKKKPVNWDLSASERKRRWNSPDPDEKL